MGLEIKIRDVKMEPEEIKRERDVVTRISKLSNSALKAAIFSIENIDELERLAKIGEDYMEALK